MASTKLADGPIGTWTKPYGLVTMTITLAVYGRRIVESRTVGTSASGVYAKHALSRLPELLARMAAPEWRKVR